jgi:hypothetical protein
MGRLLGGVDVVLRELALMRRDALVESRDCEARRQRSVEAAFARGQADAYETCVRLVLEHIERGSE